jgi:hypothetical protein
MNLFRQLNEGKLRGNCSNEETVAGWWDNSNKQTIKHLLMTEKKNKLIFRQLFGPVSSNLHLYSGMWKNQGGCDC